MPYYATLIVGCPFDSLFELVDKSVQKFNPDTGARVTKTVKQWMLMGKEIDTDKGEDPHHMPEYYLPKGLSRAQDTNMESSRVNKKIIGVTIASCSKDNGEIEELCEFGDGKVSNAVDQATDLLRGIGYDGPIRIYLVLTCSY